MRCPKCDIRMESMGYGDETCPQCHYVEYSESGEDFANRMASVVKSEPSEVPPAVEPESSYVVYFTKDGEFGGALFADMPDALQHCEKIRKGVMGSGFSHVCMSSEHSGQVGMKGATAVVDGKLPDGSDYTWVKRRPRDIK